jgi:Capsule assembly protein Wzi
LSRALPNIVIACALAVVPLGAASARGASPYLPLNLSPEIERQIERVLILADRPIMSRPIAAATVLDALSAACRKDEALCRSVRRYLDRYMGKVGLGHASAEGASGDDAALPLANRHGLAGDSAWQASLQAYWQPNDYVILSVGGVGDENEIEPAGSMLTLGFDWAQLDVGYRDHWFSPFTDSAMIISTQARTLPSVTLSNYKPISRLGLQYEVFLAEMETSDEIAFLNRSTTGEPRLAGLRFAISPAAGWSLGANRMMQFGGGERGGSSFGDFIDALIKPHQNDNRSDTTSQEEEFGNQVAAWTSRFIFPGSTPFAAYLEYAGEDNSYEGNYRLGNAALSIGITFPRLWDDFDLTYEASDWQNGWYSHGIYTDGLRVDGRVIGHWGANARAIDDELEIDDAVGAQTHMLRLGWEPDFGGLLQLRARTVENESYGRRDYERGYDVAVSYSRAIAGFTAGAELMGGRDVFGDSFGRVSGFVRFGEEWQPASSAGLSEDARRPAGADLFVAAGANMSEVQIRIGDDSPKRTTSMQAGPHVELGARRAVSGRSDFGVRLELDRIEGDLLLGVRALDYRYRFDSPLAFTLFAGAARYDLATPAYGYYYGAGVQWRDIVRGFDLSLDLKYADKVARDKLLPSDPPATPRPDSFYDISSAVLSLSYRY